MFKVKFKELNKQGAGMTMQKVHHFDGFKPKTAMRVQKLVTNIQAHQNKIAKACRDKGNELGGTLNTQGSAWEFKDKVKEKEFDDFCAAAGEKEVEINCKKLSFKEDVEPYYEKVKLTPSDWGNLNLIMDGAPVVD